MEGVDVEEQDVVEVRKAMGCAVDVMVGVGGGNSFVPAAGRFIPSRTTLALGGSLCLLQAIDGIFTSMGVSRFGLDIEGNPVIRALMEDYGQVLVLTLLKLAAILAIITLIALAHRIPWLNHAMGALNCIYVLLAILPWAYILFIQPYVI